jgi:NADH-quinone oxidoreductase subunit C
MSEQSTMASPETANPSRIQQLADTCDKLLGKWLSSSRIQFEELTLQCASKHLIKLAETLRDHKQLQFAQLIDLCAVDYHDYKDGTYEGPRFAVVYHLLSLQHNQRVRLKVFCDDDDFPVLPSMIDVWPVANWFEREAFDLFGVMFQGHPDLRRLLTDYGFVGHPFRKDFPMIGNVEMRYDPEQQRVVYEPVSIELRNNVPRVIRDEGFHHG